MKLKRLFAIGALLPLTLLCGCGGTISNLSFNANWYKNTSLKDNLSGTKEELSYEVSFKPQEGASVVLSYTDGVYTTSLLNGQISLDNSTQEGYIYATDLSVKVQFSVNGAQSEIFEDKVHSEIYFLSAARGLRPVKSLKSVKCHSPLSDRPASLEGAFQEYDFSYDVDYTDDLTEAKVHFKDNRSSQNDYEKTFSLKGDGTFLDNEQILFALRGVDLSAPSTFRSLNLVQEKAQSVSFTINEQQTASVDFSMDGEDVKKEDLAANSVTLHYTGTGMGEPQTLIYAKTTDPSSNLYRNVLLEMQVPVYYSLGTLTYTLKSAAFATK